MQCDLVSEVTGKANILFRVCLKGTDNTMNILEIKNFKDLIGFIE